MKKIVLIENYSYDLLTLRLDYVFYLKEIGYDVSIIVPDDGYIDEIKERGIDQIYSYPLDRKSLNPIKVMKSIKAIRLLIENVDPDIVHTYRIQPNFLACFVLRNNQKIHVVNHVTGLGYAFASSSIKASVFRKISLYIYHLMSKRADVMIFQNDDDLMQLTNYGINDKPFTLIKGSGVDENDFSIKNILNSDKEKLKTELKINNDTFVVITVARLIWEKGIKEFVEASKALNEKYDIKFISIGWIDVDNPSAVTESFIKENSEFVTFLGKRRDVKELLSISDVYVLQSYYREGVPRASIEALAMELPIITTEMPGCKLTVNDSINGYKIKEKSSKELIDALTKLIENQDKLESFSKNSRILFENEFCNSKVYSQMVNTY